MRINCTPILLSLLLAATIGVDGFNVFPPAGDARLGSRKAHGVSTRITAVDTSLQEDCGCGPVVTYGGQPSDVARAQNPRKVMGSSSVVTLNGERKTMNDILDGSKTSLVIFLRSLG